MDTSSNIPSNTLPEQHHLAMALLQGRHPGPTAAQLVAELPPEVVPLLWTEADRSDAAAPAEPRHLLQAAWRLRRWPAGAMPAAHLGAAMACLGSTWRQAPVGVLFKLAERLRGQTPDALTRAEARHLASWGAARCPGLTVGAARRQTWAELTEQALAWRANDEVSLRRQPERRWACPLGPLTVHGVRLQPVTHVAQLLASGHDGVLMTEAAVLAMESGLQAWFLLRSRFGPAPLIDACCALERRPGGQWERGPVYAPPRSREFAERVATSLLAQARLASREADRAHRFGVSTASQTTLALLSAALRGGVQAKSTPSEPA